MHNLKLIRKDPDFFIKKLKHRSINTDLKKILSLDKKNSELNQSKEKLQHEKKVISKKQEKSQFSRSKEITKEINDLEKSQLKINSEIELLLSSLPNLALDDVPIGKAETSNKVI